jgi:hypothetical protein
MKTRKRIINKDVIKALSPCESGYKNYLIYYENFNGSLEEFLLLENIPYSDKVWLIRKICVRDELVLWSCRCVESVLHLYEKKYPHDFRPRKCIEVILAERSIEEIKEARDTAFAATADAAAYAADAADAAAAVATAAAYSAYTAAYAAASAAAYSAASAASAAAYSAYTAAYADADAAAASAAATAAAAADTSYALKDQENKNIQILIETIQDLEIMELT